MVPNQAVRVIHWGLQPYLPVFQAMQQLTTHRTAETEDEWWVLEHEPVLTQGYAGRPEHLLRASKIPVIQTDRGGQITYHGPGQLIVYTLIDVRRSKLNVHQMVHALEQSVIDYLANWHINAERRKAAPGVYVDNAKLCSVGLRIRRGCSYHGLALNVDMDLSPFADINPCGYQDLAVTQLRDLGIKTSMTEVQTGVIRHLQTHFEYNEIKNKSHSTIAPHHNNSQAVRETADV